MERYYRYKNMNRRCSILCLSKMMSNVKSVIATLLCYCITQSITTILLYAFVCVPSYTNIKYFNAVWIYKSSTHAM